MESNQPSSKLSTLNVTKIVSISLVLFAVITQLLDAVGAISLSTTQQVTVWLVVAGLIVLLWIADMACRAYVTAATYRSGEPPARPYLYVPPQRTLTNGPGTSTPGLSGDGSPLSDATALLNGPRLPVEMEDVFPKGCYLVPDSISETYDYDEKTEARRASRDKITGKQVYQCRVVDMDPDSRGRSRETVVKIVADQMPVPPTQAQYGPVEFDGLTGIPFATDHDRTAYASLQATGIKQAMPRPAPNPAHATS
jgi:hypothetical protein